MPSVHINLMLHHSQEGQCKRRNKYGVGEKKYEELENSQKFTLQNFTS